MLDRRLWPSLLLVALATLVVLLFLVARRRSESLGPESKVAAETKASETPRASLREATPDEARVSAAAQPPAPGEDRATPVRAELVPVRSSIGVPIERVEVLRSDGAWQRIELVEHALTLPVEPRPVRIRAPGHLAAELAAGVHELVLEPHTSLVLVDVPLARVKSIDPFGGWPTEREAGEGFVSAGACDATTWGIAFDAAQLRTLVPDLEMEFQLDDGTEADLRHMLEAGRHDTYAWPRAPLDVQNQLLAVDVERAGGEHGTLAAEVHAYPDSITRTPGSMALVNQALPWGRFVLMDYLETFTGRFDDAHFELGPLVVGKPYVLTVRDEASGDHERRSFVHDGSPVRLRLTGGVRLHGIVDVAPAMPLAHLEHIVWSFGEGPANGPRGASCWSDEAEDVPLAADGSFELVLPGVVPWGERAPFPRSTALALEFSAGGFEPRELRVDTTGASEIDLGAVRLEPLPTQLVLAPGHGLVADALAYANVLVDDLAREATTFYSLDGARVRADGSFALALTRAETGDGFAVSGELPERALPWRKPDTLVLEVDGEGLPFRADADGSYRREPTRTCHLRLEAALTPGAGELVLLWEWQGIFRRVRSWPSQAFERPQECSFIAPAEGALLRWFVGKEPRDAHAAVAIASDELSLRVP